MATEFMQFLKDNFENIDSLNLDQLRRVILETNAYFQSLENILRHGDPKEKEAAVRDALEIKEFLDSKANHNSKFKGLDDLSPEELEVISEMSDSLKLTQNKNNKIKIKKLKPINLS